MDKHSKLKVCALLEITKKQLKEITRISFEYSPKGSIIRFNIGGGIDKQIWIYYIGDIFFLIDVFKSFKFYEI